MSTKNKQQQQFSPTREKIHEIIFEADTPLGKYFDVALIVLIIASVIIVLLESIESIHSKYGHVFDILEWGLPHFLPSNISSDFTVFIAP